MSLVQFLHQQPNMAPLLWCKVCLLMRFIYIFREDYTAFIQCQRTNALHYTSLLLTKEQLLGTAITARNASPERDIAQEDIQV